MTFKSVKSPLITFSKKLEFKYHNIGDCWKLSVENRRIAALRTKYLSLLSRYRNEKKYIAYMDETYLTLGQRNKRKNYHRLERNFDLKSNEKAQHLIIVHGGGINGFIKNALLVFQSDANEEIHHKGMNYEIFSNWMVEKCLPNLPKNSVIIFDNASYHNAQVNRAPTTHSPSVMTGLDDNRVSNSCTAMRKRKLYCKVPGTMQSNKKYKIDEIVENAGHIVLRLPPFHTELNPIETIWALTRDKIKRQYAGDEYDNAIPLVVEEFSKIGTENWQNSIKSVQTIEKFYLNLDAHLSENIRNSLFDFSDECKLT